MARMQTKIVESESEGSMPAFFISATDNSVVDKKTGEVKETWVRVGAAWPRQNGDPGYVIRINALPLNWNGSLLMQPPLPKNE